MHKLIVGNWKMNGLKSQIHEIEVLKQQLANSSHPNVSVVICPPATLLSAIGHALAGTSIQFGAQDCHQNAKGAHTGDLSAAMFADLGATYCIVGHSERRADHGETNAVVCAKAKAALTAGLRVIICVGESEAQRDAGQAIEVVLDQVKNSVPTKCEAHQICIAYEPVWAIGTGRVPSVADVEDMHASIRDALVHDLFGTPHGENIALLYGGSDNGKNAADLLAVANVNGALVGGASLTAASFMEIITSQL